jgi:hypothetical protein
MKAYVNLWLCLAEFFLQSEMFQTNFVQKIETHILRPIQFSRKSCRLCDNVQKYCTARQVTDNNIIRRMRFACLVTKAADTHSDYVTLLALARQ